jgi:hypothetical protein
MATKVEKDTAAPAKADDGGGSAFSDVTGSVEQAKKDAEKPVEVDKDGKPVYAPSEAQAELDAEMATRAAAHTEGGGPWPPELLAKHYIDPGQPAVAAPPAPEEANGS